MLNVIYYHPRGNNGYVKREHHDTLDFKPIKTRVFNKATFDCQRVWRIATCRMGFILIQLLSGVVLCVKKFEVLNHRISRQRQI